VNFVSDVLKNPQYSSRSQRHFHPVEVQKGSDKRGSYQFDPLQGLCVVVVKREDGEPFKGHWKGVLPPSPNVHNVRLNGDEHTSNVEAELKDLDTWVRYVFEQAQRTPENVLKKLREQGIDTLKQLMRMSEQRLSNIRDLPVGDLDHLLEQRQMYGSGAAKKKQEIHEIARLAKLHQVKRFFAYHCGDIKSIPCLNEDVVKRGIAYQRQFYKNDAVLTQLFDLFLLPFTKTMGEQPRGLMLYGPPGTGKTVLVKAIAELCGLFLVEPMMMAAEVNKSLVGESEELIRQLFTRATLMPHLPCIVALDEIDSAVPKRDDSGGGNQHGADKVSTILGLIGGGTDVANLHMIGATNRREAIDDPIRRRMPVQVYVGFPDEESRRDLIVHFLRAQVPDHVRAVPGRHNLGTFYNDDFIDKMARLTMNFSGAALKELCQGMLQQWERYYTDENGLEDSFRQRRFSTVEDPIENGQDGQNAALMHMLTTVSHSFNLKVGGRTIPELLSTDVAMATEEHRLHMWKSKFINNSTGLMVVKPDGGLTFRVETYKELRTSRLLDVIDMPLRPYCPVCQRYALRVCKPHGSDNDVDYRLHIVNDALTDGNFSISEENLSDWTPDMFEIIRQQRIEIFEEDMRNIWTGKVDVTNEHILREAAYFAQVRKLNRLVYVDSSTYVLNNAASNEQKILEEFTMDVKQVLAPGSRALLVIDLDSFAGITFSESEGSMSSKSYNLGSRQLFEAAIGAFISCRASFKEGEATIRETPPNLKQTESWCIAIIRNDYLMRLFRERTQWPLSKAERRAQEEEEREQEEVTCARCLVRYREADNKDLPGNCQYHPCMPVHIMSGPEQEIMIPMELGPAMKLEREIAADPNPNRQKSEKLVFGCCGQPVAARGGCCQIRHRGPDSIELPCQPCRLSQ